MRADAARRQSRRRDCRASSDAGKPRPFTDKQIELLETFADQAVIAIENVRLFRELEARNRELTEALEQQTATSEILRVISSSPTDVQPVFDTIAQSAVRVCDGTHCVVFRFDGELVDAIAHSGLSTESVGEVRRIYPLPLSADTLAVRSIREGRSSTTRTCWTTLPSRSRRQALVGGYRSGIMVPLLRSGTAVGVIAVGRSDPRWRTAAVHREADRAPPDLRRPGASSPSRTSGCSRSSRRGTAS